MLLIHCGTVLHAYVALLSEPAQLQKQQVLIRSTKTTPSNVALVRNVLYCVLYCMLLELREAG
jgi:hypothetical protein